MTWNLSTKTPIIIVIIIIEKTCFGGPVIGHVVIDQLFIESYSGRILVPLGINNNYPKDFFFKNLEF